MFTVALIGPDGAGKTTIGRRLEQTLPLPVRYVYMGINYEASNHVLPTTRLIRAARRARGVGPDTAGPRDPERLRPRPKGLVKRVAHGLKSSLSLANRIAEESFRHGVARYYQYRGFIVLFDRHFYSDYYAYDIAPSGWTGRRGDGATGRPDPTAPPVPPSPRRPVPPVRGRPVGSRIHGFLLERVYPKPDLVIYLDAPAEVLFARKGEGTLELLERRRHDYLEMRHRVKEFAVVDASRPADAVAREVTERIWEYYQASARNSTTEKRHVGG